MPYSQKAPNKHKPFSLQGISTVTTIFVIYAPPTVQENTNYLC